MDDDKKKSKDLQDDIRNNLQSILNSTAGPATSKDLTMPSIDDDGLPAKLKHPDSRNMDFYAVKDQIEVDAKNILKSVMEFYVDKKIIKKDEYLRWKKQVDEEGLSNILFALKTCQHAIIKLMEEIDMGQLHPRNFEVLAALNGQLMSVVKHQAAFMVTLEEGYKKIKYDHDQIEQQKKGTEEQEGEDVTSLPLKVRGTRQLMQNLQNSIKDAEVIKDEETDGNAPATHPRLTDPLARPANTIAPTEAEKKESEDKKSDDNPLQIDDKHFG